MYDYNFREFRFIRLMVFYSKKLVSIKRRITWGYFKNVIGHLRWKNLDFIVEKRGS